MAFGVAQSNRTQTSIIETVALIVIIVIVGWFFVKPQRVILGEEKSKQKQAEADFQSVSKDKETLAQLISRLKQSGTDITLVDEALPLQNRPTKLEFLLNSMVTGSGLKLSEMNFQPVENSIAAGSKAVLKNPYGVNRDLRTTVINLSVSGGVDQLANLLKSIETNGRIIDVTGLDISNEEGAPTFKIKLKSYAYVP